MEKTTRIRINRYNHLVIKHWLDWHGLNYTLHNQVFEVYGTARELCSLYNSIEAYL